MAADNTFYDITAMMSVIALLLELHHNLMTALGSTLKNSRLFDLWLL